MTLRSVLLPLVVAAATASWPLAPSSGDDCPGPMAVYGKIQVVESFADCEIEIVESFEDLRVKVVENFPDDPGEWQMVESFPDYTVTFVESFPDFTIKYVDSFPGPRD